MKHSKKLQAVSRAVKQWRARKRYRHERMPEALWARVEDLLRSRSVAEVSQATGISPERLNRRRPKVRSRPVKASSRRSKAGDFLELPTGVVSPPALETPVEFEMRRADGTVWSARVKDGARLDWKALAEGFVRGGPAGPGAAS